jgi:hypothetical protein
VKAKRLIKVWESWPAIPSHLAATSIKIRAFRASSYQGSSSSNPRKNPLEGSSPHLRKPTIVVFLGSPGIPVVTGQNSGSPGIPVVGHEEL